MLCIMQHWRKKDFRFLFTSRFNVFNIFTFTFLFSKNVIKVTHRCLNFNKKRYWKSSKTLDLFFFCELIELNSHNSYPS